MIEQLLINKINNGEIKSRRQLYRIVGRSRKLLKWLNSNKILIPKKWTKEMFILDLKKKWPIKANDDWELCRLAKRFYGTWNNALLEVIGDVNQYRYTELSDNDLKNSVINYIKKYKRLPLREEFNGSSYEFPYWESITERLGVKKWNDIYSIIDLSEIKYYNSKNHGSGRVYVYNGNVYLSRHEFLIGEFLTKNKIDFEKEVPYEDCNYIFDFYLPKYNVYIEYYGLSTKTYKENIIKKRKKYNGRKVIEIFKHDNTLKKLELEVQRL